MTEKIRSEIVNCSECIFYTPNPGDAGIGECSYKKRNEVVFEDDYCSRSTLR